MYQKTNEVFVADGYGDRRIIVFDADTGAFKRLWGAFGNAPDGGPPSTAAGGPPAPATLDTDGPGSPTFSNPVHAIKISNDGLVYVADRSNRRVQVFTPDGKYVNQVFINRAGPSNGSAAGLGFSPDSQQQFLYVSDLGNSHVVVLIENAASLSVWVRAPGPETFSRRIFSRSTQGQPLHGGSEPRQSRPEVPLQGHVADTSGQCGDRFASAGPLGAFETAVHGDRIGGDSRPASTRSYRTRLPNVLSGEPDNESSISCVARRDCDGDRSCSLPMTRVEGQSRNTVVTPDRR